MNAIQKRIETPMSNEDLEKYLAVKPEDIIKYSELSNCNTIHQLLLKEDTCLNKQKKMASKLNTIRSVDARRIVSVQSSFVSITIENKLIFGFVLRSLLLIMGGPTTLSALSLFLEVICTRSAVLG